MDNRLEGRPEADDAKTHQASPPRRGLVEPPLPAGASVLPAVPESSDLAIGTERLPRLTRAENAVLASVLFMLAAVAIQFVAMRTGVSTWSGVLPIGGALVISGVFWWQNPPASSARALDSTGDAIRSAAVVAAFAVMHAVISWPSYVLPSHDPLTVPVLARSIVAGSLPLATYDPGTSAYAYPPGEPILLSPLLLLLGPIDALLAFKILIVGAVALIPAAWAWMHARLFPAPLASWQLLLIAYLTFFGLERTLGFTASLAVKCAVLLALLLFPATVLLLFRASRQRLGWTIGAVAIFGLTLIHYTMLHLFAAFLGSYVLVALITRRIELGSMFRLLLMGVIACGLMVVLLREAISDPRAESLAFAGVTGLRWMLDVTLSHTPIVIYNDADFGISKFPYRGPVLLLCTLVGASAASALSLSDLRNAIFVYALTFVISLMFACRVIPAGMTLDYARWYFWAVHAATFMATAEILVLAAARWTQPFRSVTIVTLMAIATLAGSLILSEAQTYHRSNDLNRISRADLAAMAATLESASAGQDCRLIGDSVVGPDPLVTIQQSRLLDYAEAVTPCRYLNGSWVNGGVAGSRALDGLPSAEMVRSIPARAALLFVGREERLQAYAERLAESGLGGRWHPVGRIGGFGVWKWRI